MIEERLLFRGGLSPSLFVCLGVSRFDGVRVHGDADGGVSMCGKNRKLSVVVVTLTNIQQRVWNLGIP